MMINKFFWLGLQVPPVLGLLGLDIDGYVTGTEFLTLLANAISSILIALLNVLTLGAVGA